MKQLIDAFFQQANEVILDKQEKLRLAFTCLLANGHLLIEDIPGVGKTTLVQLLAKSFGFDAGRIQFTNDILPSDIVGNSIFDPKNQTFHFHRGPIFAQLVLADELNRATPKTQSALLQAMEEREISVDGQTHALPKPFFVVATQNPRQQVGTFPLPESELDRFLMRMSFGYPNRKAEQALLLGEDRRTMLTKVRAVISPAQLMEMQAEVRAVHIAPAAVEYIQDILDMTRSGKFDCFGLSPRAGLALVQCARAWAWLEGRKAVLPDDVQAVGPYVIGHRIGGAANHTPETAVQFAHEIIATVKVA